MRGNRGNRSNRSFLPCRGTNFFSSRARKICHPWLPRLLGLLLMLVLTYKFLYRFQNPGQGASTFWTTIGNEWKMSYLCSVKNDQTSHQKWQDIDKQTWIHTLLLLSISVEKARIRPFVLLLISSPICSDLCFICRYICPKHPRNHTFSSEHLLRTKKWCIFQPQTITLSVKIILSKRRLRWTYR